jgi:crossover junction endodeoxyribonuclease RuvC
VGAVNILGIDPSLTSTGLCWADDQYTAISSKGKGIPRLIDLRNWVMDAVYENKIDFVCIESYSFSSRNSHAHSLGELGGVIRVALYETNIPWADIPPTSRSKFATGKGNASKNEVVSSISARTGIVWSGKGADDMCDAWVLRQMGLSHFGESNINWPESHLAALDKIEW